MVGCLLMAYLWNSMVMEWNINGMSMGFNSDILEYSWDIAGDIGKNILLGLPSSKRTVYCETMAH